MAPNDKIFVESIPPNIDSFLSEDKHFSTKAIHSGCNPQQWSSMCVIPPISLSTTYEQFAPGEPKLYDYSRSNNPNREILEKSLAALDGGKYGLCFSSGLGAINVIMQLLQSGDHVICIDDVYGGTNRYFKKIASKFNISVTFFDFNNLQNLHKEIKSNTKLIWLECPTNPLMKVVDITAISSTVKLINTKILVIVDNTFLTSYFQKPLALGADIVLYSLSKYMNGHSDVIMGAIVLNNEEVHQELRFLQNATGVIPSPFDCYLVERSLKTLKLRMKEHMENGLKVAKFLESHPLIEEVLHPGLKSHSGYKLALRQWSGCSGMLSFYLKGDLNDSKTFLKNLKYFKTAESLGGFESLAEIPSLMTHMSVPPEMRKTLKITDNLIRLSVGLESVQDLIDDLNKALNAIKN